MSDKWNNNSIQFPRLLSEISAVIEFTQEQKDSLCASMDLEWHEIKELFFRADNEFEAVKLKLNTGGKNMPTTKRSLESMTASELKEILNRNNVSFRAKADRKELRRLIQKSNIT